MIQVGRNMSSGRVRVVWGIRSGGVCLWWVPWKHKRRKEAQQPANPKMLNVHHEQTHRPQTHRRHDHHAYCVLASRRAEA